jgi:hypothetical protein
MAVPGTPALALEVPGRVVLALQVPAVKVPALKVLGRVAPLRQVLGTAIPGPEFLGPVVPGLLRDPGRPSGPRWQTRLASPSSRLRAARQPGRMVKLRRASRLCRCCLPPRPAR